MTTLIIGGGLSGLALAEKCESAGHDYLLIEGRSRFGGRIKVEHHQGAAFDMGPAWFWPGQPRMAALIGRLGLQKFDQFSEGIQTFEDPQGQVHRSRGFSGMQGSWRVAGGLGAIIETLADRLPEERKRLNSIINTLAQTANGVSVTLQDDTKIVGKDVVLALPPRLAAQLNFEPELPESALQTMRDVPTWMAGQAKAIAIYDRPFWREAGLSGEASSRLGPMVEIHDASPKNGGPYALFGFISVPAKARHDQTVLREQVRQQLGRLFGPEAITPVNILLKDWAADPFTANKADLAPLYHHPSYGFPPELANLWGRDLEFAGTEFAAEFGGFLEGALESADVAFKRLTPQIDRPKTTNPAE